MIDNSFIVFRDGIELVICWDSYGGWSLWVDSGSIDDVGSEG